MIYFVIRVIVNALTMAITIIITPGLDIQSVLPGIIDISGTYLLLGLLFGVINAFVRPLVLLLTARLLVRTMGLFAIVINAFLFWLLALVAPQAFVISDPSIVWIIIGASVMALVSIVMEAFFGLDKPEFHSRTETQFYWRWVAMLSLGRRNVIAENLRVGQVMDIIGRYTKDIAVEMTPLARLRNFMQDLLFRDVDEMQKLTLPEKVRYMLQELGPTFVKFGQIVSSRADQIPPEWQREMEKLQSNVAPFSARTARAIIQDELGDTPEALFATFEEQPFAAASTAQVHKATLKDGTQVVIKIQRPNIDVTVKADLNVMRDLAKNIQQREQWAREIDLRGMVDEFASGVATELDYRNEATNMRLLAQNMQQFSALHIPRIFPELSTSKVLTMEFIKGVKINEVDKIEAAGLDRKDLARQFTQAMTKQVLFDGFFHADPHPGNILVELDTGRISFLDLGLMGEMSRQQRMAMLDLLYSIQQQDGYSLGKAALRLSSPMPGREIVEAEFLEKMERFGRRYLSAEGATAYTMAVLQDTLRINGLRMDRNLTLAIKTLVQADEVVHRLDPDLWLSTAIVESSLLLAQEQLTLDEISKTLHTQASRSVREVLYRLPSIVEATTKWLDQYESGRLTIRLDTSDLSRDVTRLDKAMNRALERLVVGLALVGWLIGAAVAATVNIEVMGFRLSNIAFYMFIAGLFVGAYIIFSSMRRLGGDDEEGN
jgi:ubiquinone biosynthesis protein